MFPRISDLINYLLGTRIVIPVQSYGFMLALSFLIGACFLYLELKRKELAGEIPAQQKKVLKGAPASFIELISAAIFGFLIGWKGIGFLLEYSSFSLNPQEFILSGEGSFISGILLAAGLAYLTYIQKKKKELKPPVWEEITIHPRQLTGNIVLVAAIFGIIGSKIFDILERPDDLFRDPLGTIFSFSGLTFYGGLIIAAVAVVYYASRNRITFPQITDAVAPSLILSYAIGRIGCQLSGDGCWGVINPDPKPSWLGFLPDWVWSFQYPHNVIDEGIRIPNCTTDHCFILANPVYPTPFYETVLCLLIFIILWSIRKHLKIPGYLFSVYLILNGIERFLMEHLRINKVYSFFGIKLTQAEMIALFLILLGCSGFWFFRWMKAKKPTRKKMTPSSTAN